MRIRFKLTLQFSIIVSTITLISFWGIYYFTESYIQNRFYERLKYKALTTAELITKVQEVTPKLLKEISKKNRDVLYKEKISIFDFRNNEIFTSNDTVKINVLRKYLNEARIEKITQFRQGELQCLGIPYNDRYNRLVVIAGAVDLDGDETLKNLRRFLISLILLIIGLSTISGWFFASRALRPITEIISEVNEIYPKNLDKRLNIKNEYDELGQLTKTFNNLLNRVEEGFFNQRTFIANVNHELKNPLTKITSQLSVALLQKRSIEQYEQTMGSVLDDVRELGLLSNALLELTKLSDDDLPNQFDSLRIDEILWDARAFILKMQPDLEVQVDFENELEFEDQLLVLGNSYLIRTAFNNLMENGCKFSNTSSVKVTIEFLPKNLLIRFKNKGVGISPKDEKLIFQPFFRAKNTANTKGYGIGLALTERIIKLHKGELYVESPLPDNTILTVRLPCYESKV
jgi:signal transduction histidine kinase